MKILKSSLLVSAMALFANAKEFKFIYGASNIPHDDKVYKGGEDAWLAQNNLLVVADGVGSWAKKGIDSGLFSKQMVTDIKLLYNLGARDFKLLLDTVV